MPNPPAARSHEPAPMPAGAADPLPWGPQGPACHPVPRLISRPQINPASEIRPARSPAWAGSLVPRFTTAKPASPWHSQARVWLCLSPKPSSQHRLLGRASTSTTAAEPRPFSSLRFAFQDKKKKAKQLPPSLGSLQLRESSAQARDDYQQHPLPGRIIFVEESDIFRGKLDFKHVINRGKRLSRRQKTDS